MANHGYIPHSGRNITLKDLIPGLKAGLNIGKDISIMAGTNALALNPEQPAISFDLDMLNLHNVIEHDNSLTRADHFFGDNHSWNQTVYEETLQAWKHDLIGVADAVAALSTRIETSRRTNPHFVFDLDGSTSTTASYLSTMGDAVAGEARRDWVKYFFGKCRVSSLHCIFVVAGLRTLSMFRRQILGFAPFLLM